MCERHRVDPQVEQFTAGEGGVDEAGRAVGVEGLAVVCMHRVDLTERSPSSRQRRTTSMCGRKRVHMASIAKTPAALADSMMSRASLEFRAKAFSTSTGLPGSRGKHRLRAVLQWGEAT